MTRVRVIPILLIEKGGVVKTVRFDKPTYVGDPINAVKIFNEKEVDEIAVLDIAATLERRDPGIQMIKNIASECFMPMCYGGGVRTLDEMKDIYYAGVEKISLNTVLGRDPKLISEAARRFGSQSVMASIDVRKNLFGKYQVCFERGQKNSKRDPVELAKEVEDQGAGEILLNSVDRDGTYVGYDVDLIRQVSRAVSIPIVACGGAKDVEDLGKAVRAGASAVAAGSLFVFHGVHRAVLINFPTQEELKERVYSQAV